MSDNSHFAASHDAMHDAIHDRDGGTQRAARPAPGAPVNPMVLEWERRPRHAVLHNLRRAQGALRATRSPVLLLRGARPHAYRHALFPTDLSAASLAQLRLAVRALPHAAFTLLHPVRASGDGYLQVAGVGEEAVEGCRLGAERRARAAGRRFVAQAGPSDLRLAVLALRQPWALAVAGHAGQVEADLLVLGGTGGGWWTAQQRQARLCALLSHTDCDVLLLPAQRPAAAADPALRETLTRAGE